jgi:hypothetical protein
MIVLEGLQFRLGEWHEEQAADGAVYVFRAAVPVDGAIVAKGLYVAIENEVIAGSREEVEDEIVRRTAIEAKMGNLTIHPDFADVLALLPRLVADATKRIRRPPRERCQRVA